MTDVPQEGVQYDVVVSETVTGGGGGDDHYHVLQYRFKPASIDRAQDGILRKTNKGEIEVEFAVKPPDTKKVHFKGQYTPSKDYDCILIFDSGTNSFRLERLMGQAKNLTVDRKDSNRNTSKLEVPQDPTEDHTVRGRGRPKSEPMPATFVNNINNNNNMNGNVTSGSSPEALEEVGGPPAKKRRQAKTPVAPKRPRKATGKAAESKPPPLPASLRDSTEDLLALVDQIESSVPSDNIKPEAEVVTSEGEAEDLADLLESDLEAHTETIPVSLPPPPSHHPPPASKPKFPPSSFPSHPPASHPMHPPSFQQQQQQQQQQQPFGYQSNPFGGGFPGANGGVPPANGAANGDASSDSGSESESASESESESESDSESSSESESENE